jgi:hypothetical protein
MQLATFRLWFEKQPAPRRLFAFLALTQADIAAQSSCKFGCFLVAPIQTRV